MKMSEDFRQAREKMLAKQDDSFSFICWRLKTKKAKRLIMQRISPHATIMAWLRAKHGIVLWEPDELRKYRIQWLDRLIEEFEAKGQ